MRNIGFTILLATAVGVTSSAETAQQPSVAYRWAPIGIVGGGYVPGIVFHPAEKGLAYARTDIGGAYRWEDSAQRWIPLTDWIGYDDRNDMGVESIALDPKDPNKLYLAVGMYTKSWASNAAVLRSSDRGKSFERFALPFKLGANEDGRGAGERLSVDPVNSKVLYLGSRHDGLWRSLDQAVTWKKIDSFPAFTDNGVGIIAVLPVKTAGTTVITGVDDPVAANIYAAVSAKDGGLFHSSDGGQTWQRVPKQPTGLLITNTALSTNGMLYLTFGNVPGPLGETDGAVWRLELANGKWTEITPAKPGLRWPDGTSSPQYGYGGVAVSVSNPEILLASTLDRWEVGDGAYRSIDGGHHWADIATGQQPRYMGPSPWLHHTQMLHGTGAWPTTLAIDPFDPNHVFFATGETVWTTHEASAIEHNQPVRWFVGAEGIEETAVFTLLSPPTGPHLISGVRDIGAFRHDDLSLSPRSGSFKNPELADTSSIAYAANDPAQMVRVGSSWTGTVFGATSHDQGVTWTPFATQPAKTKGLGTVAISADGKVILWAGEEAPVSVSRDMGKSWTVLPVTAQHARVAADPINPAKLYMYVPADGSVLVSTDAGVSFKSYAANLPRAELYMQPQIYATPGREGDLWVSSDQGLFHSAGPDSPFVKVDFVGMVHALGFGKAAAGSTTPTLFLFGNVHGLTGIYASLNSGEDWIRIDDDSHRFGDVRALTGDPRIFGRLYVGTEGRGIIGGDPLPSQQTSKNP